MTFNITEIQSAITRRGGLTRPSHFMVVIYPPRKVIENTYSKEAMFFCDTASLPGLSINTQEIKVYGYGTSEKRPYDVEFQDADMTFMVDGDGKAINFFHRWVSMLNNFTEETQGVMVRSNLKYGEWAWPSEYEGIIEVYHYDPSDREVVMYTLYKAYPVRIGNISVGWEQNDTITRLPVSFSYKSWTSLGIPPVIMDGEEAARAMSAIYNQTRVDYGLMYSYGLHLLQNGQRSPLSLAGAATTFINRML